MPNSILSMAWKLLEHCNTQSVQGFGVAFNYLKWGRSHTICQIDLKRILGTKMSASLIDSNRPGWLNDLLQKQIVEEKQ